MCSAWDLQSISNHAVAFQMMQDGDDGPIAAKSSADKLAAGSSLLIDPTVQ